MSKVLRYFTIKGENLCMYSRIDGEFKEHQLRTIASFTPSPLGGQEGEDQFFPAPSIWQDADGELCPWDFRLGEMAYFLQVLSLFNPLNKSDYELPQSQTEES